MKLKHVDLIAEYVYQDARDVRTKFSKTFNTYFFSVGDEHFRIVEAWVSKTSNDWLAKGTMGERIFIRSAGMFQRAASKSNSVHFAPINSLVRTKLRAISLRASRVTCVP
jgi:hypothetical protein